MQVLKSLHDLLSDECTTIHATRLKALMINVAALIRGQTLTVTGLGRAPKRHRNTKHDIKQSDRLIGNVHLQRERALLYGAIARHLLARTREPIILIDWSDYTVDRSYLLLRASVPVGGRALTLYEQVHPLKKYGNAAVQRAFLDTLQTFIDDKVQPIVVTDAGFIGPWFTEVRARGWHYVGRIRKNLLYRDDSTAQWTRCAALYAKATSTPRYYGLIELARRHPLRCHLHLLRQKPKGRHRITTRGQPATGRASQKNALRETSPWLIVTSLEPATHTAKHVIQLYKTRMQIELAFRDIKNYRAGFALRQTRSRTPQRLANLLLVGMLANFCLWLLGRAAIERKAHYRLQANTHRRTRVLSSFFIACQLVKQGRLPTRPTWLDNALALVHRDIDCQAAL